MRLVWFTYDCFFFPFGFDIFYILFGGLPEQLLACTWLCSLEYKQHPEDWDYCSRHIESNYREDFNKNSVEMHTQTYRMIQHYISYVWQYVELPWLSKNANTLLPEKAYQLEVNVYMYKVYILTFTKGNTESPCIWSLPETKTACSFTLKDKDEYGIHMKTSWVRKAF